MSDDLKLVVVRTYTGLPEATLACSVLQGAGLDAMLADENVFAANWLLSAAVGGVKLLVPTHQVTEAIAVLDTPVVPATLCSIEGTQGAVPDFVAGSSFCRRGHVQTGRGWTVTNWAWATLRASDRELSLSAPLLGRLSFAPEDVLALHGFTRVPYLSWGIRVTHLRHDLPDVVRFATLRSPTGVLDGIAASGFRPVGVEPNLCLGCGAMMTKDAETCGRCGWTYVPTGGAEP